MSHPSKSQSWARYWEMSDSADVACLPGAPLIVTQQIEEGWRSFFNRLPKKASVLDLGTGGGAVLKQALTVRDDLDLIGVDYSSTLPPCPASMQVMAGVDLTALPFDDNAFDAVTSQFAIEYADLDLAVAELGRVLKSNGQIRIMAHHADSIVCAQNDHRMSGLEDMLAPEGLVDAALEAKRQNATRDKNVLVHLDGMLRVLQEKHGKQGVVMEVLSLLAPMLVAPDGLNSLEMLAADMQMEVARLSALSEATLDQAAARALVSAVSAFSDVELSPVEVEGVDLPIAWLIS